MYRVAKAGVILLGAFLGTLPVAAEEQPAFIDYGKWASPRQGDNDHRQAIYLSVPASTTGRLYLRIFDPDTGGAFDQIDKKYIVSTTRFAVFGGEGAFVPEAAQPEALSKEEMTSGTLLGEKTYHRDRKLDGTWQTIADFDASAGDRVGDRLIYRLLVDATGGVNGNVFDVALSTSADDNVAPEGLRLFSYSPTVRMPRRGVITELKFAIPPGTKALKVGNFDAAYGTGFLTTKFLSFPLLASGQGDWKETEVQLPDDDKEAAVTLSGGREYPNDATFYGTDQDGKLIPFEVPPRVLPLNGRPHAVALQDPMGTCTTVHFAGGPSSDPEHDPLAYAWQFGDGSTATDASAIHEYTEDGHYTARLEVTDNNAQFGNSAAAEIPVFVKKPPVALSSKRLRVGAGEDDVFDGAPSTASKWTITTNEWDLGDGTKAIGDKVTHAFAKPGNYTVTHRVVDDSGHPCNSASEQFTVRVNAQPVAEAGPDQRIAIGEEATFNAGGSSDSDGSIASYAWEFGDGAAATGKVVRHAYAKPATYTVKLHVADDANVANSGADDTLTVIVNDPPIPNSGPNVNGAIDEVLTFDGSASKDNDGKIIAYEWDFGDGAKASGEKVTHAYAKSGAYTATLTVSDDSTTKTRTVSDATKVRVNEPPVANAGPDQLVTASEVQFDGSASSDLDDSISKYEWDFGDGAKGEGPTPKHVYARPGTYDVVLTVTDASGTIHNAASDHVQIIVNAVPIADAGPDLVGAPGEELILNGGRSLDPDGSIAEYDWDFRDGATAKGKAVKHAFQKPGTYAVRLTVHDNTGQAAAVDYAETSVFINAQPVAGAGAPIATVPGAEVHLSAVGSYDIDGQLVGYRWDFSDQKEPVEGKEVIRVFKDPGVYTAQLTVTDDSGAANALATDTVTITVNHQPVADAGPDIVIASSTITFDGTKSVDADGNPLRYAWDFGDGQKGDGPVVAHTYAAGGTYPVILTVDDGTKLANATATAAIAVKINRPPVAVAGENKRICTGDIIVLDGSKSSDPEGGALKYSWTFGDGTGADIVNPTKSYSKGGTYPLTLTVRDDSGLSNDTKSAQIAVRVDQGPVARANKDIRACAKTEVHFDGSASTDVDGVVNSYFWDFGDGGIGGGENPSHIYDKPGTYRAFLRIQGEKVGICDSSSTDEIAVTVIAGPVAVIKAPAAVPITEAVTFDGSGSSTTEGKITGWHWDFGDGQTADGVTATHRYAKAGVYQVALTLDSDSTAPSCRQVSARRVVTINAPPVADAGADKQVAVDEELAFDGSVSKDPDGGIVAYAWEFGDGDTAAGINVTHRYRKPGTYTAKLTVRDGADLANSSASVAITVTVNPVPKPTMSGPKVACVGETVAWTATDKAARHQWNFGDGGTAITADASHVYKAAGLYSLSLLADDGRGVGNSQQLATAMIHVNQPPHADAGPDQRVCPSDSVKFDGSGSMDPDGSLTLYRWDFGDGQTADGVKPSHVYAKPGTYPVHLTVTDDAGSSCSMASDVMNLVVNAPPVPDAGKDREVFVGGANDAVLLDGSASYDPDGSALAHTWSTGDGGSELGERVRHTFATPGDFPVTLSVSDTSGLACSTASTTVHIIAKQRP